MAFVDEVRIHVRAGDGGNGAVSFRREKFVPRGGPDGGNGGPGGSVILRVEQGMATLSELARAPHQRAVGGENGGGSNKNGAAGTDRTLSVPPGTVVRAADADVVLADLIAPGDEVVVARGGAGGRGNASFATPKRRAPGFAEKGEAGEERWLALELRLLADVGLVGFPNAGKSSLISRLSAAKPKIADYPFTTLSPNLGVATAAGERFVVADVPGIVEGASEGRGLGLSFLRHLERCPVLCFVLDLSQEDPSGSLAALREELRAYEAGMLTRPAVVAANKIDIEGAPVRAEEARAAAGSLPFVVCSALNGDGVGDLETALSDAVCAARIARGEPESHAVIRIRPEPTTVLVEREEGWWRVRNPAAERLIARFDLSNAEAVTYVQRGLIDIGVEDALLRAGAKAGDEVHIGSAEFEFTPESSIGAKR
ncbi:MAG: GTPase ObgE [Actinomycetota bacterium]|nr:GTPase ObgE [Actinomycetota bacterium]